MNNNTHMNDERHTTASELYAKLQSNKNSTTFAELNDWYGVGNYVLKCVPLGETAYWTGLPKTVCAALIELKAEKKIIFYPCSRIIYLVSGMCPTTPIVKSVRKYKKLHWFPTVLHTIEFAKAHYNEGDRKIYREYGYDL